MRHAPVHALRARADAPYAPVYAVCARADVCHLVRHAYVLTRHDAHDLARTFSRQHDSEPEELAHRIAACENGVEDVCTELAALNHEDARATDEHRCRRHGPQHTRRGQTSQIERRHSRNG